MNISPTKICAMPYSISFDNCMKEKLDYLESQVNQENIHPLLAILKVVLAPNILLRKLYFIRKRNENEKTQIFWWNTSKKKINAKSVLQKAVFFTLNSTHRRKCRWSEIVNGTDSVVKTLPMTSKLLFLVGRSLLIGILSKKKKKSRK